MAPSVQRGSTEVLTAGKEAAGGRDAYVGLEVKGRMNKVRNSQIREEREDCDGLNRYL